MLSKLEKKAIRHVRKRDRIGALWCLMRSRPIMDEVIRQAKFAGFVAHPCADALIRPDPHEELYKATGIRPALRMVCNQ